MRAIKIFLETEEHDRVQHYAENLGVSAEDVAYTALRRLIQDIRQSEDALAKEIVATRDLRHPAVAYWTETTRSIPIAADPRGNPVSSHPGR